MAPHLHPQPSDGCWHDRGRSAAVESYGRLPWPPEAMRRQEGWKLRVKRGETRIDETNIASGFVVPFIERRRIQSESQLIVVF